jgi:hypothetical protein
LTTIAIATADETDRVGTVFAGNTLASGDVMVMYTYAGDSSLDGFISVDDYATIDFYVGSAGSGYYKGDFNYDGIVSVDDYALIDFNLGQQGEPIVHGASTVGTAAVPEPSACGFALLTASALLRRRRRT